MLDTLTTPTIGDVAIRSGMATSALRYYEREGLVRAARSEGGQRRYEREVLRRIAFIRVAQRVGLTLAEIRDAMAELPDERTPTVADWARLSRAWRTRLTTQIELLERLRDDLTSCIGCGCLSFKACKLYNPDDAAAALGDGPRYLLGDRPGDVATPR
jgi:MerR family redox-sensitive transcriptional activator SoxR